jgi:hypothetical protein
MGINLALQILEGSAHGGHHGGRDEAIDELTRESFWMTDAELERASRWAATNSNSQLQSVIARERQIRRLGGPVSDRTN